MAEIIPMTVSSGDELAQALDLERTAIIVTDKKICQAVREKLKKTKNRKKASKIGKITSSVAGVGSFIAALFGPVGIFVAATGILTASVLGLGGSALAGINTSKLDEYKVALASNQEHVLLVKASGKNAIKKDDTVRGFNNC